MSDREVPARFWSPHVAISDRGTVPYPPPERYRIPLPVPVTITREDDAPDLRPQPAAEFELVLDSNLKTLGVISPKLTDEGAYQYEWIEDVYA